MTGSPIHDPYPKCRGAIYKPAAPPRPIHGPPAVHISTTCRPHINHPPSTHQHTNHTTTTRPSHAIHIRTTCQPHIITPGQHNMPVQHGRTWYTFHSL